MPLPTAHAVSRRDGGGPPTAWFRVIAGVVAERAFVAQQLGRVHVTFDDEVGLSRRRAAEVDVGRNGFQFGQNV